MKKQTIRYTTPLDALIAIAKRLGQYENRYKMESEEFFYQYGMGKLPEDIEFTEWAGDYQHYLGLRREVADHLQDVA